MPGANRSRAKNGYGYFTEMESGQSSIELSVRV